MGWASCGEDDQGRPIGYAHSATCDEPGCAVEIDRGLAYVCGGMHGGDENGCGGYFCGEHLFVAGKRVSPWGGQLCGRCLVVFDSEE